MDATTGDVLWFPKARAIKQKIVDRGKPTQRIPFPDADEDDGERLRPRESKQKLLHKQYRPAEHYKRQREKGEKGEK